MTTYAIDTYPGDGSTVAFAVSFDFISRADVTVYRDVIAPFAETELTVITTGTPTGDQFIWDNDNQITVGTAPTAAQRIRIQRDTPEAEQIVQWQDGSYIIAEDLNESDNQMLYNIQELYDMVTNLDGTVTGEAVKRVISTAPVEVDNTDDQEPIVSVDETVSTDDPNSLTSDTRLMSELAIDNAFRQHVGTAPATGNKVGQIRIDNVSTPQTAYWWNGSTWVELVTQGQKGDKGDTGPAPGLQTPAATVTNIAVNPDGSAGDATAAVSQDAQSDLQFQFGIPVGATGAQGIQGIQGPQGDGVTYLGAIDATTAAEPSNPNNGDFYINTVDGTSSWTGLSTVVDGSRIIYNSGTSQWDEFTPSYATDLGYTAAATGGTITNTNGADATLPAVDATNAGLMTPAMLTNLETDPSLDDVLTTGNTSATSIVIGSGGNNSTIGQGTGTFTGKLTSAATVSADAATTLTTKGYVDNNTFVDAPTDGAQYGRQSGGWTSIVNISGTAGNALQLGGVNASSYIRSDDNSSITGNKTFEYDAELRFGDLSEVSFSRDSEHFYTDLTAGSWYIRDGGTIRFTFSRATGNFTATGTITAPNFTGTASQANLVSRGTWGGASSWRKLAVWSNTTDSNVKLQNATAGDVEITGSGKFRAAGTGSFGGNLSVTGNVNASGAINGTLANSDVRSAMKSSSVGTAGTYAALTTNNSSTMNAGDTRSGGSLRYCSFSGSANNAPSGNWRLMGRSSGNNNNWTEDQGSVWLRIS